MDKYYTTPEIMKQRIKQFLSKGNRFDGRKTNEFRDIEVELGISKKAEGSCRVRIGKTEVIVGVKMDVGAPYADNPDKGNLMTTAEMLPLSSPRFEAGPPKFPAIEIGRVVDRGLRESGFINFEKLCIKEGEKVWTIFVDIYTINDDGNLMDAAGIGAIIALKNSFIPEYDEKTGKVNYGKLTNKKIELSENVPIPITIHKIGENFIVDPTREEEDLSETRVTIGSSKGVISSMQKGEANILTSEEMEKILDMNDKIWNDIFKKIKKFLK